MCKMYFYSIMKSLNFNYYICHLSPLFTSAKQLFSGLYRNQPVCPSVYKILLILCRKLLQFCFNSFENLYKHWSHNEVLQDIALKCQLRLVLELSPLELSHFLNMYHVQAILFCKFLQFCFDSYESLYKHWSYTGVVQHVIFMCQLSFLYELSPLQLSYFF